EALGSTKLNLLLDVGFNREVGEDGAIYWQKDELSRVIEYVETINQATIANLNFKSTQRILSDFTWEKIVADYEGVFCFAKS
ncbi:TPA: glycosyl transferase, partial [Streptococcus pneumoniae]